MKNWRFKKKSNGKADVDRERSYTVYPVDGLKPKERRELRLRTSRLVEITRKELGVEGAERVSPTKQEIGEGLIFLRGRFSENVGGHSTCVNVLEGVIHVYSSFPYDRQEAEGLVGAYSVVGEEFRVKVAKSNKVERSNERKNWSKYL